MLGSKTETSKTKSTQDIVFTWFTQGDLRLRVGGEYSLFISSQTEVASTIQ